MANILYKPISLDLLEQYRSCLALCPQKASDYSPTNLFGWADVYGLEWGCDGACVFIRQTRPEPRQWAPVGPWDQVDWTTHAEIKPGAEFFRVPEALADLWSGCLDTVREETRGQWDYVYLTEELTNLKGKKFIDKRNHLNYFKRTFDFRYHRLEMDLLDKVLGMQRHWLDWTDCPDSPSLLAESKVIELVLHNWNNLPNLLGGVITIDDQVVAYTVAEPLDKDTMLIHFEKGDHSIRGAYQAINQMFLEHEARDFRYVNREQDLDEPGLRKAKLSYNPACFLKKYTVRIK